LVARSLEAWSRAKFSSRPPLDHGPGDAAWNDDRLARLYRSERNLTGELEVIACAGWQRQMDFSQTGLPWVLPSPNMPTLETAYVYSGGCLFGGTNLSEGRGTTRPFELIGAPWLAARQLASRLYDEALSGVIFRPAWFRPRSVNSPAKRAAPSNRT
jgi:uncharacterized protein YbbC (DUF1343 family)